jgi:hypothetical protein
MNSFKERVSMKDETTIPEKLLSHKAGYANTPALIFRTPL